MLKCRPKSWPRMLITIPNYIVLISVLGSSVLISIFDSRELTSSPGSKYVPDFLMGWSTYPLTSSPRNHTILEHCNTMVVTKISFFLLRSFSSYVASQASILVSVFCLLSFFKKKKQLFDYCFDEGSRWTEPEPLTLCAACRPPGGLTFYFGFS